MTRPMTTLALALAAAATAGGALAADPESCETIRLFDPGWTDINSTNAVASTILEALGYDPNISTLSVAVGFEGMKAGDIDVFLGNWMPAHAEFRADLEAAKAVEVLNHNLAGAKFTLAVPSYVGITDFAELAPNADRFGKKIYGIDPGTAGNAILQAMIENDDFGLGDWELVETSEQAMLAQVERAGTSEEAVVFLAWAPHPMNVAFDITYLAGGDAQFGPNYGGADVFTVAKTGWAEQCPNAAQFFKNLAFTLDIENEIMASILDDGDSPDEAAEKWLKAHPDALGPWLEGVTTLSGEPGLPAVQSALGL
jgi:glycine betaine/proline transport system substrate-binding protein